MTATPRASIEPIAPDIYRVSVALPFDAIPGGFSFNQYLVVDERPLLFHTGPRRLFELIRGQIETVIPASSLRYVAFSHVEADECGSLGDFLALAPNAQPVCSEVAAMVSVRDMADAEPVAMAQGQRLDLGRHQLHWQSAPHVPHGWDCGYVFDDTSRTLFCGDLFTQPGTGDRALVEDDILGPSETMRAGMDYFAHGPDTKEVLAKLADLQPRTLACMHGSAWAGDGAALLRELGKALSR